jgi:DNA-binding HxlR family transcriptional regulator
MKKSTLADRYCPIARASLELVDSWTFLIVRELLYRNNRFDGIQQQTGMNPRTLSARLGVLVENGILQKSTYSEKPIRNEYGLTEKGRDLWPVVITMKDWGEKWAEDFGQDNPPLKLFHGEDNHTFSPQITCADCSETVTSHDLIPELSEKAIADRELMLSLNSRKSGV